MPQPVGGRGASKPKAATPRERAVAPVSTPTSTVEPALAPAPEPVATTTTVTEAPDRTGRADRARPGQRFHVVQPGESLWSIATDLLPATATTGEVARESAAAVDAQPGSDRYGEP